MTVDGIDDSLKVETNFGDSLELSRANGFQIDTPAAGGTHLSMTNGTVDLTSAQAELHLTAEGDINMSGPTASASLSKDGDVSVEGPTASANLTKDGDISLTGPVASASLGKDGAIEIKNATASLIINAAGQVELKGAAAGVVQLLQEFAMTLATDTFAGFGAPAGQAAKYLEIATKAQTLMAT